MDDTGDQPIARALANMEAPKTEGTPRSAAITRAQDIELVHKQWRRSLLLVGIAAVSCVAVVAGLDRADKGVEVVETGFSQVGDDVGYGVVVENTRDQVAYHTVVCVRLRNDGGCRDFTIEVLLPGQRVGFGSAGTGLGDSTGVEVDVHDPLDWLEPDEHSYGEIVTSDLLVAYSPDDDPVVSFLATLDEEGGPVRNATAFAVFRDSKGDIVAGTGMDLDQPVGRGQPVRQAIQTFDLVAEFSTAEVYVFPSGL